MDIDKFKDDLNTGVVSVNGVRKSLGLPALNGFCSNCGNKIAIQIFKGGRWCSDNCRKALGEDVK